VIAQEEAVLNKDDKAIQTIETTHLQPPIAKTEVSRRGVLLGGAATFALMALPADASAGLSALSIGPLALKPQPVNSQVHTKHGGKIMDRITTKDGTQIYFKDWGTGKPVVFSHGWPLSADAWDAQMLFLGQKGYRVIAHDRRGHGRSGQSWAGNNLDTYADDLAELIEALDLKEVTLVGHSTGGGEVTRYVGRHGNKRLAKLVLVGAIPPVMLKSDKNPGGLPISVFDAMRASVVGDRSQMMKDLSVPFYGYNKPDAKVSQGVRDSFWLQAMQASVVGTYDCIKAFSETDLTEDLKQIEVPTLILHGDQDQIVPIADSALLSSKIIKNATLKIYPGAPHGMTVTQADEVNADLLAFLKS
jgi:non-heme chloroperoxidase